MAHVGSLECVDSYTSHGARDGFDWFNPWLQVKLDWFSTPECLDHQHHPTGPYFLDAEVEKKLILTWQCKSLKN